MPHHTTEGSRGDSLDVFRWPKDGHAEGCVLVGNGVQVVKDDLLHLCVHLLHLTQYHAALSLNLTLAQC